MQATVAALRRGANGIASDGGRVLELRREGCVPVVLRVVDGDVDALVPGNSPRSVVEIFRRRCIAVENGHRKDDVMEVDFVGSK